MKNPGPEDQALIDKESGDRIQESGEIIELMEYWNNGMMVLGAKNFIGSIRLHSRLIALNPLFQHSSIPKIKTVPLFITL
ncbi:MAG: hypothetical protein JSU80_00460 [Deltaproteobacteria bacterium]|nr:MAG: hypothetical protein JSU80_00460 [Deltaproteobacteria bacterium]